MTTQYIEDAKNFNRDEHMGREERYERARESLDVVRSLWDSWATDAFVQDKSTGQYLDPARVRLTNHRGKHFKVKGPLNVARTPQGQPVVFMAGQSDDGKELAAYGGEGLFGTASNKAGSAGRVCRHQGPHAEVRPAARGAAKSCQASASMSAAPRPRPTSCIDELQSLISPALGVSYLSKIVGLDLTKAPLDGPMPRATGRPDPGRHGDRPLGARHGGAREAHGARDLRARAAVDGAATW